jgi:7,8-dihydropterin-6-yl-methyl-4-(beta-D-ribofuranosyl)aminobenzene 5'-phosphate synthase
MLFAMLFLLLLAMFGAPQRLAGADDLAPSFRVTVLSTMVAETAGFGEWGFAALVESDGRRVLFDTGAHPDTVLRNAEALRIDLSIVVDVVLTHNHGDHTSGLLKLRAELSKRNPKALSRAYVGAGIFYDRPGDGMKTIRLEYEKGGGQFIEVKEPLQLMTGVWLTGPVPRVHTERNWSGSSRLRRPDGSEVEDNIPEDMSMIANTARGLVLLSGCGHAGIINTIDYARKRIRSAPVIAAIGGFHLFPLSADRLEWTAARLREAGLKELLGAHCTGIEATYTLRKLLGLDGRTGVVGQVGSTWDLKDGIKAYRVQL